MVKKKQSEQTNKAGFLPVQEASVHYRFQKALFTYSRVSVLPAYSRLSCQMKKGHRNSRSASLTLLWVLYCYASFIELSLTQIERNWREKVKHLPPPAFHLPLSALLRGGCQTERTILWQRLLQQFRRMHALPLLPSAEATTFSTAANSILFSRVFQQTERFLWNQVLSHGSLAINPIILKSLWFKTEQKNPTPKQPSEIHHVCLSRSYPVINTYVNIFVKEIF